MNRVPEDAYASETRPASSEQPADAAAAPSATTVNLSFLRGPQGIGVGSAVALTAGASLATVIYMRRRARPRMRRLAWLALRAALLRAVLRAALPRTARRAATFGGLGGGVLAAAVLRDRVRHARSQTTIGELNQRLADLQAQVDTRRLSDRPRPRDLILGAAVGLGLAGIISRAGRRKAS